MCDAALLAYICIALLVIWNFTQASSTPTLLVLSAQHLLYMPMYFSPRALMVPSGLAIRTISML